MSGIVEQTKARLKAADKAGDIVDTLVKRQSEGRGQAWPELDALPELDGDTEAPAAFPFDALGPVLGPAAEAVAHGVQAPDALAGSSLLAAAAVAAQPHADVLMPHGQRAPLSEFFATAAGSGERKSATDQVAGEPIDEERRRQARKYAAEVAEHKANKGPERTGPPPSACSLIVSKGTTEGMHHLLRNQSHVGLFSTEGAELVGGHSMREERRSAGIAWMLKAWGAETLDHLTRSDGLSVLIGRRVTMNVLLQPVILHTLMADPLAQGQGWIARCLIASPRSLAGTRMFVDQAPVTEHPAVQAYYKRLRELLAQKLPLHPQGDGFELQPRVLKMSDEARALWIEFYNECERQQADGQPLAGARAWSSKAAEHAARIAGITTMIGQPDAELISLQCMEGALGVTNFYMAEHLRLMGQTETHQHLRHLHALLAWLRTRGRSVAHADVLQYVVRPIRMLKAKGINKLLDELAQRHYIRRAGDRWEVRP